MNTLIEAHRRKLEKKCSITSAIEGLADELYEMRKAEISTESLKTLQPPWIMSVSTSMTSVGN